MSGGGAPRASGCEGQRGLSAKATQDCRRAQKWRDMALELRTRQQLLEARARPTCGSPRASRGGGDQLWLATGARALAGDTPGNTRWCDLSWRASFWHWDLEPPNRLQTPVLGHLNSNRTGMQPRPSGDRPPKDSLTPRLPITHLLTWACPSEGRDPAAPASGQAPVPPPGRHAQACGPTSHTRGQTPAARRARTLQLEEQWPETES